MGHFDTRSMVKLLHNLTIVKKQFEVSTKDLNHTAMCVRKHISAQSLAITARLL